MVEVQFIVEKIKSDFEEGKPGEAILQALVPMVGENSEILGQVADALGNVSHPMAGQILLRLLETSADKKIRKIIKRSLYRLKSRGIPVEEVLPRKEESVFKPLQPEPPRGYGGPFDFLGQRFLMLIVPHTGRGVTVMQGILSDTEGLIDFFGWEMPRKRFKDFFEEVQKGSPFPLIEIEPSYVGWLFVQAGQQNLDQGGTLPQDFRQLKKEIEKIKKDYEKAPIYSWIQKDEVEEDSRLIEKAGDLLKMDVFLSWRIDEEEIQPYADEVREAEESKLILNQAQKEARFQEIYQRGLLELFPEEKRSLYSRRMEEMAYYLLKLGKEEEAKISLAVAIDLKKPLNVIRPNPFLFHLVVKSIFILLKETSERKAKEPSFILKP